MNTEVPVVPVPDADARLADLLATDGEDLRGCMRDGYTDDDVSAVLGRLARTEFVGPIVTVLSGSALESGWSMGVTEVFGPTGRHAGWVCQS
jgi:hypothetical protein